MILHVTNAVFRDTETNEYEFMRESLDGKHRYLLGCPSSQGNNLIIIGLNPSTAIPEKPDRTMKSIMRKTPVLEIFDRHYAVIPFKYVHDTGEYLQSKQWVATHCNERAGAFDDDDLFYDGYSEDGNLCYNLGVYLICKDSSDVIDEAYALSRAIVSDFIALMEDRRADTVVILAGYAGHMNVLLDSNPGFRSRLGFTLQFPHYSLDEKVEIFRLMCHHQGYVLPEESKAAAEAVLARSGSRPDQGNARFVRNLLDNAVVEQSSRVMGMLPEKDLDDAMMDALQMLLPEDFTYDEFEETTNACKIGFMAS